MPSDLRRTAAVLVLLAGVTTSAGCGFVLGEEGDAAPLADIATERVSAENGLDEMEPVAALDKVVQQLRDDGSFHVTGTVKGGALDITYLVGEGAVGTIGAEGDSSPVEMIAAEGRIYVAGDKEFLSETVGKDAAETIGGKWLLLADDAAAEFDVLSDGQKFAQAVFGDEVGEIETTGVREVDGVPAIGFLFRETGSTLWVAASGDPRPLRFEEAGASGGEGVLTFDVGTDVELTVPDKDDVVDAENLPSD